MYCEALVCFFALLEIARLSGNFFLRLNAKGFPPFLRYVQLLMLGFRCFLVKRISRQIYIVRIKLFKFTSWKPTALFSENHKQNWRRLIGQIIFYIIYVDKQVLYCLYGFIYYQHHMVGWLNIIYNCIKLYKYNIVSFVYSSFSVCYQTVEHIVYFIFFSCNIEKLSVLWIKLNTKPTLEQEWTFWLRI